MILGGTIHRVDATTWATIQDAAHQPVGIGTVELLPDRVRVHFAEQAAKIVSFVATPDEAFAASNVRVGASVGLTYADIYFYMPAYGSVPVDPALLTKANANVWLAGWFEGE